MSDSSHPILIGVDGGGTKCRAAIGTCDHGVLAEAVGGAANAASDPELAIKNIIETVEAAALKASIPPDAVKDAYVHLGLAGVMTDADSARISKTLPYANSIVTDDRPTTVSGALGGADGFVIAVGTGTIVASSKAGVVKSVNGWGFHVSDQASGAWLGRATLVQILLCHDGLAEHTDLTKLIFAEFDNDPNEIVAFSMSAKPSDYGTFTRDIVSAALGGDPWGKSILKTGANYLTHGLAALGFKSGDLICLTGGVGPQYAPFLSSDILSGQIVSRGNALDGAFELARANFAKQRGGIK
jgi:glucosamine kinase